MAQQNPLSELSLTEEDLAVGTEFAIVNILMGGACDFGTITREPYDREVYDRETSFKVVWSIDYVTPRGERKTRNLPEMGVTPYVRRTRGETVTRWDPDRFTVLASDLNKVNPELFVVYEPQNP